MTDFNSFLKKQLAQPELRREYEDLESEFAEAQKQINSQGKSSTTQKETDGQPA